MSDPLNNEILDVLSSIRRLVSEERKGGPGQARTFPRAVDAPEATDDPPVGRESALPKESRFVLTQALRVSEDDADASDEEADRDEGDSSPHDMFEHWEVDAAEDEAVAGEAAQAERAPPAHLAHAATAEAEPTLESTIAELEAAVAGLDTEYEPDGGETAGLDQGVIPEQIWQEPAAKTPVPPAFGGIIAGFEALTVTDERLDQPITGEVMYSEPAAPFATTWLRSRVEPSDPAALPIPGEAEVAETDGEGQAAMAVPDEAAAPDGIGDGGLPQSGEEIPEAAADDMSLRPTDLSEELADEPRQASMEPEPHAAVAPLIAGRLHLEAEDPPARPRILRAQDDAQPDIGPDDHLTDLGADDGSGDLAMTGEDDLLDPLAVEGVDISLLRDMVVEIIREELRGTLGERITRNVRGLVRREILRVLSEDERSGA